MRVRPVPARLHGIAFRRSEARGLGVSPRSRAPEIARPFHGVRSVAFDGSLVARCRAFEPTLLDGQLFSHTTALALWGIPVPTDERLHVAVAFPRTPPRGRGLAGHSLRRVRQAVIQGLPVVPVALAWRQAASLLDLEALVVAGDAAIGGPRRRGIRPRPRCSIEQLRAETAAAERGPGARNAAAALELIRSGVGSPAETRVRLVIVGAGLPEPVVDHPVAIAGGRIWHPDLAYPHARIAIEYEGEGHRTDRARWRSDIARREAFEDAGWRVVRVTADALADPADLLARLGTLLANRAELR
jgi:hypothetical protein